MSNTLQTHGLQHTRLPSPSLSTRVCSNSCLLSQWCHVIISSSVAPFPSCLQSFPASGSFPMSRLFASNNQNPGASASALPVNIQGWSPLRLTGLISLLSKGLSRVFSSTTVPRHQFFGLLPSLQSSSHNHVTFVGRVMSLLFKTLSRFVIAFLPRSNCLLISWLQSIHSDFRVQEEEICHYFYLFPFCLPWSNGAGCHDLSFLNV